MDSNNQRLIPSADLAEFYTRKIGTALSIIYNYRYELNNNKILIVKINLELEEIYKQIKHRLLKHGFKDLIEKIDTTNSKLLRLKPLANTYVKDVESGGRIKKTKTTKDYLHYKKYVTEKECLIWEGLDLLGLLGKVDIKTRPIR